jgi:thermitase
VGLFVVFVTPAPARSDPSPGPVGAVICVVDAITGTQLGPCPTSPAPAGGGGETPTVHTSSTGAAASVDRELVPDLIVAKFERGASEREVTTLVTRLELTTVRRIPSLRLRAMRVKPERRVSTLAELERSPLVERAEQDRLVELIDPVNPVSIASIDEAWGQRRVGAPGAWGVTHGSHNVKVAVIDTGVDASHPDLRGAVVAGYDVIGNDADPHDENGHGTAVAGIIGARASSARVARPGLCSACTLMSYRVLGADGFGTTSTIADGIVRAVNAGARVLNLSLGSNGTTDTEAEAVNYALSRGVVVVAAAGNDGREGAMYPAAFAGVISVAATDEADKLYSWSNRGADVRFAAPGCNAAPALRAGYAYFCGTSSSTPMVSGIAALVLSVSPQATVAQLQQALERTAVRISGVQFGRVDAARTIAGFVPKRGHFAASGRGVRNYRLVVGSGTIDAVVSAKGQRLEVVLFDNSGATIATAGGRGSARIKRFVEAGTYTLRVTGAKSTTYAVRANYTAP